MSSELITASQVKERIRKNMPKCDQEAIDKIPEFTKFINEKLTNATNFPILIWNIDGISVLSRECANKQYSERMLTEAIKPFQQTDWTITKNNSGVEFNLPTSK